MVTLVLLAMAVRCWPFAAGWSSGRADGPRRPGDRRLRAGVPEARRLMGVARAPSPRLLVSRRPWSVGLAVGGGLAAVTDVVAALPVALGLGVLTAGVTSIAVQGRTAAGQRRRVGELHELVRRVAREVRAGTSGAEAVSRVLDQGEGRWPELRAIVADPTVSHPPEVSEPRSPGPAGSTGRIRRPSAPSSARSSLDRAADTLVAGWRLSHRWGVPWAPLLDALTRDLEADAAIQAARSAEAAGPRLSGYLLAALPLLGLLLGVGMGTDPIHVLFDTRVGSLLVLAGCSLTAAGLCWTARIVRAP